MRSKKEFLDALAERLRELPQEDIRRSVEYYGEMIDDRMEDGMSESEAVCAIGSLDSAVSQILSEIPLTRIVRASLRTHRLPLLLLILGAPLWIPLLLVAASLLLTVYAVIWSGALVLISLAAALAACGIGGAAAFFILAFTGSPLAGGFLLGTGLASAGISIPLLLSIPATVRALARLGVRFTLAIKHLCVHTRRKA